MPKIVKKVETIIGELEAVDKELVNVNGETSYDSVVLREIIKNLRTWNEYRGPCEEAK